MAVNLAGFQGLQSSGGVSDKPIALGGPQVGKENGIPTGSPGTINAGNAQNPTTPQPPSTYNPFQVPLPAGAPVMNPGGAPTSGTTVLGDNGQINPSNNSFNQTDRQQTRTLEELQSQYGEGMGSLIFQYLQSGGGYNSALANQTVDATNKAMIQNIQLGMGNLSSTLGAQGISPNSSTSALETSNFESNALTQMNAIDANIYNSMFEAGQNREESILQSTSKNAATTAANDAGQGVLGDLTQALTLGGTLSQGISGVISAFNPGADTGVLDTLGGICWVAASFWGWNDFRTSIVRRWVISKAPSWFRKFYMKYGERISKTPVRWLFRIPFEMIWRANEHNSSAS